MLIITIVTVSTLTAIACYFKIFTWKFMTSRNNGSLVSSEMVSVEVEFERGTM